MLLTLLYFFLALLLLINVHEFGHFIIARCCGVKVLRFSFGFGKILARWHDKHGTEFAWSIFPIGGYVKMLDETEEEVPKAQRHLAFNNKSVWARMAIVVGGPLFNFLFAFVALWLMLVIGIKSLAPMIDDIKPGSIAAQAGLKSKQEILSIDGKKIASWRDFHYVLMPLLGTHDPILIKVKSLIDGQQSTVLVSLTNWQLNAKNPDLLASLGITPFVPAIPPIVGEVVADSPAQTAGLRLGDVVHSVNGQKISDWLDLVDFVRIHPDTSISLQIQREGQIRLITAHTGKMEDHGRAEGFLGVRSQQVDWPAHWLRVQRETPLHAINVAFHQTMELTGVTVTLIGRLVMGKLPLDNISGPVGIAQGAGDSARSGLAYYLSFLALVSISLGVLNLLPIPMLDGGHLLYCLIEVVRRRPVPEVIKSAGVYVGFVLLLALMIIGLTNDISRLAG